MRHQSVLDPGYTLRHAFASGSSVWFGAATSDEHKPTHLDGIDVESGRTARTPSTPWTEFTAADATFGWGIDLEHGLVVEYDLQKATVARRLPARVLAGSAAHSGENSEPLSVAVAGGVAYVLGWQKYGHDVGDSWLAAVDEATGAVRWTRDLHDAPGGWSWVPRAGLAASVDGIFVVYTQGGPPGSLVARKFDAAGRLRAQREVVVPQTRADPARVVVGTDGVYAMVWTPVVGWRDDTHEVVRLSPTDLSVEASVAVQGGWDLQVGATGVWATVFTGCDDSYLARMDPRTLVPSGAYRLAPYHDDDIDASSSLLWVVEQSTEDGSPVEVNGYDFAN